MFITHDLSVGKAYQQRYRRDVSGPVRGIELSESLFRNPLHPLHASPVKRDSDSQTEKQASDGAGHLG